LAQEELAIIRRQLDIMLLLELGEQVRGKSRAGILEAHVGGGRGFGCWVGVGLIAEGALQEMLLVPAELEEDLDDDGGVVAGAGEAEEDVAAARMLEGGLLGGLAVLAQGIMVAALAALDVR